MKDSITRCAGGNVFRINDRRKWLLTRLPDGRVVRAIPQRTESYLELAIRHGYGSFPDPAWQMCREHDTMHTLLALEMDLQESPTLREVVERRSVEFVGEEGVPRWSWIEEGRVMDLQLYLNTDDKGRSENHGRIYELSWEFDLPSFRRRALAFLRNNEPWRES